MDKIKIIKVIVFFVLFLFSYINVFSYDMFPTAVLKTNVDKMEIGETVKADVYITVPTFVELVQDERDIVIEGWEIQDFVFNQDITDSSKYILNLFITTFDSKINKIPRIRLSFTNKNEITDSNTDEDKFYFFSNSVPIHVNSIVGKYNNNTIFDIKNIKELSVPFLFYVVSSLFVVFVLIVIYGAIFKIKEKQNIKITLSPKENAIRKLNQVCISECFDEKKIKEFYFLTSEALRVFILDVLKIKNIEMTTNEIISMISDKENRLFDYQSQISYFFKKYDDAKYSSTLLYVNNFIDIFNKTKSFIENFDL